MVRDLKLGWLQLQNACRCISQQCVWENLVLGGHSSWSFNIRWQCRHIARIRGRNCPGAQQRGWSKGQWRCVTKRYPHGNSGWFAGALAWRWGEQSAGSCLWSWTWHLWCSGTATESSLVVVETEWSLLWSWHSGFFGRFSSQEKHQSSHPALGWFSRALGSWPESGSALEGAAPEGKAEGPPTLSASP